MVFFMYGLIPKNIVMYIMDIVCFVSIYIYDK